MARSRHNPLADAHHGYAYQDAATAFVFLWALYEGADGVVADSKAYPGDLFDDITIRIDGRVLRRQYKWAADAATTFSEEHLRTTKSDLRIDHLVRAFHLADGHPADEYRICATWKSPTDPAVTQLLEPSDAPGSFGAWPTKRWKLRAEVWWPVSGELIWALRKPFAMRREQVVALVDRLVIELECPEISRDQASPGPLERLIYEFLAERIGVGRYPNRDRSVEDVAERLIRRASQARAAQETVVPAELLPALGLRTDFGRVAQQFPVIAAEEVRRADALALLQDMVRRERFVLVIGSPGSGKSWLLTEFAEAVADDGVLVAKHYCYLQPGDQHREQRITADVLFANLMAELVLQRWAQLPTCR
ncbi:MAG TPA: ATP-binding protein [Gemmataceae bacterium]|nr:ATP-binding protein [Gemmataceae bacterium]